MQKVLVIGLVGESVFMECDHFPQIGETIQIKKMHNEIGGKGYNQAYALKMLGADVHFFGAVGSDKDGENVIKETSKRSLDADFAVDVNERTAYATILTDKKGENQVSVYPGAKLVLNDFKHFSNLISDADIILLQLETSLEVTKYVMEEAKRLNKIIVLNPAPATKYYDFFNYATYITPNEFEAKTLFGEDYEEYMIQNKINGVVTLGKNGAKVINDQVVSIINPIKVNAVDTTGAGDIFNAALVYMLSSGKSLIDAAKYANEVAAKSTEYHYVLNAIDKLV